MSHRVKRGANAAQVTAAARGIELNRATTPEDDDPDDDVQAADQVVVDSLVAALRDKISKQMRGILEIGFQNYKTLARSLTLFMYELVVLGE